MAASKDPSMQMHNMENDNKGAFDTPYQTSSNEDQGVIVTDYHEHASKLSFWTRLGVTPESFKKRTLADKHNQLNQTLKGRHLNMIAIGGSIGAGLFVGSGSALRRGGPAALLICFGIIGIVCTMATNVYGMGYIS